MKSAITREFLGENPTKLNQFLIFSTSLLLMTIVAYKNYNELSVLPIWKSIIFMLMVLDIVAGSIANFTKSTQAYYKDNKKRITFLLMHIIHITLIVVSVGYLWYTFGLLAFTLIAAFIVNSIKSLKKQEICAAVLICIGLSIFYVLLTPPQILIWLPAILLIKLVFAFSVKREN